MNLSNWVLLVVCLDNNGMNHRTLPPTNIELLVLGLAMSLLTMPMSNWERHNSKNWWWLGLGLTSLLPYFIARICGFHLFSNFTCDTWHNKSFTSNTNRWHTSLKSRAWFEWNYYMHPLLLEQGCYFMNLQAWEWAGEHE